jgi:hypothetical protein
VARRLDGRTKESKQFDSIVSNVTTSFGNPITARQKRLIESYATACVNLDRLNVRILQNDDIPQGDFSSAVAIMMQLDAALYEEQHK